MQMKLIVLLLIAAFTIAACNPAQPPANTQAPPVSDIQDVEEMDLEDALEQAEDREGVLREIRHEGYMFYFLDESGEQNPEIRVNVGDTVRIVFDNVEGVHDWVLDEFDGARTAILQPGQSQTIEFVADSAGEFEYYCSVGSHRAMGMVGSFIVE